LDELIIVTIKLKSRLPLLGIQAWIRGNERCRAELLAFDSRSQREYAVSPGGRARRGKGVGTAGFEPAVYRFLRPLQSSIIHVAVSTFLAFSCAGACRLACPGWIRDGNSTQLGYVPTRFTRRAWQGFMVSLGPARCLDEDSAQGSRAFPRGRPCPGASSSTSRGTPRPPSCS
jgi:hypothetical protein